MKTMQMCVEDMFNTPLWNPFLWVRFITTGAFLVNQYPAIVLFNSGASHSFISSAFAAKHGMKVVTLGNGGYNISAAGDNISTN
jgi:hypothetical protein